MMTRTLPFAIAVCFVASTASAQQRPADQPGQGMDDPVAESQKQSTEKKTSKTKQTKQAKQAKPKTDDNDATTPKLDTAQIMKISRDAVTHIAAAEMALDKGNTAAAKSALAKSEKQLARLYDTTPLAGMRNELDEAIREVKSGKTDLQALDLAPIAASFRSFESYMDPELAAGIEKARTSAQHNDAKGAEEALRMVRDRVAVDIALLPVEEAYVRVLAAQQALQRKEPETARRLIQKLPIVVSQVQVSRPLVPVRFKLNAAARAAEAGKWQEAESLISEVNGDMQKLESAASNSDFKAELTAIGDDIQRLNERMQKGTKPQPKQLRELAARTRNIVSDDDQG